MKFFKTLRKRGLALFLAFVMCIGFLPGQAMAADGDGAGNVIGSGTEVTNQSDANAYLVPGVPEKDANGVFTFSGLAVSYKDNTTKECIMKQSIFFSNGQFDDTDSIYIDGVTGESMQFTVSVGSGTSAKAVTWTISPIESGSGDNGAKMRGITIEASGTGEADPETWNTALVDYLKVHLKAQLTNRELDYQITFGSTSSGYAYNAANGHYYTYVYWEKAKWDEINVKYVEKDPNVITWSNAKALAHKEIFNGMEGHLLTITSKEEQAFVQNLFKGQFWTAGTRNPDYYSASQEVEAINRNTWGDTIVNRVENGTTTVSEVQNGKSFCGWFWGDGPESELGLIYYPFSVNGTNTCEWIGNDEFVSQHNNVLENLVGTFNKSNPIITWEYKDANGNGTGKYAYNNWHGAGTGGQEPNDCANAYWSTDEVSKVTDGSKPVAGTLRNDDAHEVCMHVYDYGNWNDYSENNTDVIGFLVEFEGESQDTTTVPAGNASANIIMSQYKDVVVLTEGNPTYTPEIKKLDGTPVPDVKVDGKDPTPIGEPGRYEVSVRHDDGNNSYFVDKTVTVIDLATKVTCDTAPNTHNTAADTKTTPHLKDGTYEAKWSEADNAFVVTITSAEYIGEGETAYKPGGKTHTAKDATIEVSVTFDATTGAMSAKIGDTVLAKGEGTATDGMSGKYIVPIPAVCKAQLTNVEKELVTSIGKDIVPDEVTTALGDTQITYPAATSTIILGKNESVTLLYKITVTGTEGAQYTLTETEGAKFVGNEATVTDTLETPDADGVYTATVYAYRTFHATDINQSSKEGSTNTVVANTVTMTPGDNTEIPKENPEDPENPPKLEDTEEKDAKKKHTVTFNGNQPTDAPGQVTNIPDAQEVTHGEFAAKPETAPTLPGYKFEGWYAKQAPVGTDSPYNFNTPVTSDITLYAKWTPLKPDITKPDPKDPDDPDNPGKDPETGVKKEITKINGEKVAVVGTSFVQTGDKITYQVTITPNKNAGLVQYLEIKDDKMPGGTGVEVSVEGSTASPKVGGGYTLTPATLNPITITYTYQVEAEDGEKGETFANAIVNAVTVKAWNNSHSDEPSEDEDRTEINYPKANVTVQKVLTKVGETVVTKQPENVKPDDVLTWEIRVHNATAVDYEGLRLRDTLKIGEGTQNLNVVDEKNGQVLNNTDITVPAGSTRVFTATYIVQESDVGKDLVNTAVVSKGTNTVDEKETPKLPVVPKDKKVTLTKAVKETNAKVGDTVHYTVTVHNAGEVYLTNVRIADTINNGTGNFTNLSAGVTYDATTGEFTINATITPNTTYVFNYEYVVQTGDVGMLCNVISVPEEPGQPEDVTPTDPDDPDPRKTETPVEPSDPVINPKLSGITKELVLTGEGLPGTTTLGVDFAAPGADGIVVKDTAASVTLLYKITVTGEVGAAYKVTDGNVKHVGGENLEGTLEGTEAVIYVTKTFDVKDGKVEGPIANTATVAPGDNTDGPDDKDKEAKSEAFQIEVKYVDESGKPLQDPYVVIVPKDDPYNVNSVIPENITTGGTTYVKDTTVGATTGTATKDVAITVTYKVKPSEPTPDEPRPETWTVIWQDEDGYRLYRTTFTEGTREPGYPYSDPTKAENENYTYVFDGWDRTVNETSHTIVYTAKYRAIPKETDPEPTLITVIWRDPQNPSDPIIKTMEVENLEEAVYPEHPAHEGYEGNGWSAPIPDGEDRFIIDALYVPLHVDPDAPSYEHLRDLGIVVEVICNSNATHAPMTYEVPLKENSYEARVTGDTCTLTIAPDLYVAEFNRMSGGEHGTADVVSQRIELVYVPAEVVPAALDDEFAVDENVFVGDEEIANEVVTPVIDETEAPEEPAISDVEAVEPVADDESVEGLPGDVEAAGYEVVSNAAAELGYWQLAEEYRDGRVTFVVRCEVPAPDEYTITVRYVDETGVEISRSVTVSTTDGGRYDVTDLQVDIDGYDFVGRDQPLTGTVTADTTITLTYAKDEEPAPDEYTVTVRYVDETGAEISRSATVSTTDGGRYDVTDLRIEIAGYTLRDVYGNLTGTITEDTTVTLVYVANRTPTATHTVTWVNWNGATLDQRTDVPEGTDIPSSDFRGGTPARPSDGTYTYTFTGWSVSVDTNGNVTYTAQYTPTLIYNPGTPSYPSYPSTPSTPSNPSTPSTNIPDTNPPLTDTPSGDGGTTITDQDVPLAGAVGLNDVDHFAYIIGYSDDTVRPLNNITRAEVATIFFRLMTDEYRTSNWATTNDFSDVAAGNWFNNAISTCANAGALNGYSDGSFRPNANITRAEFAAIAARFLDKEQYTDDGTGDFSDTADHWAAKEIRLAAKAGWIQGSGNKFRPNDYITRAEVMTIVNRMLDRVPDKDHMLDTMKKWTDNPEDAWYYEAVQEATNEHAYERDELGVVETWTEILTVRDWKALEEEWANANAR